MSYRDAKGQQKNARARVIDFDNAPSANHFPAVRELKLTGLRTPHCNRRADFAVGTGDGVHQRVRFRAYPGKEFGLIVDYNGMLKSLRVALAQYAMGDMAKAATTSQCPSRNAQALIEVLEATEAHRRRLANPRQ